jgi:hypothetical protein
MTRRYVVEVAGTYPGAIPWTVYEMADRPSRAARQVEHRLDSEHPEYAPHFATAYLDRS